MQVQQRMVSLSESFACFQRYKRTCQGVILHQLNPGDPEVVAKRDAVNLILGNNNNVEDQCFSGTTMA